MRHHSQAVAEVAPCADPRVQWAYFDAKGPVTSSIVLNLTGTKVAYVVNANPRGLVRVVTLGCGYGDGNCTD